MIYTEEFKKFLENYFGPKKIVYKAKNIIIPCPWCEYFEEKKHYHCYISLDLPIFNCFYANCRQSGSIKKLVQKVSGNDNSNKLIDYTKIKKNQLDFSKSGKAFKPKEYNIPEIRMGRFPDKEFYLRKRIDFSDLNILKIKGLIFSIKDFLSLNFIEPHPDFKRIEDYIEEKFIGFLTENKTCIFFRNIDASSNFRHFKFKLSESTFLDYYKIKGPKKDSNLVILGEGIFDIYSEMIFDSIKVQDEANLYACSLSSSFGELARSIAFNEQIYRLNINILSDSDVQLNYYKKMKKDYRHLIDKLSVFYNKKGKDFNVTPAIPIKYVL